MVETTCVKNAVKVEIIVMMMMFVVEDFEKKMFWLLVFVLV